MRRVRLYATTLHFLPQPYPATAWRRGCREVHLPLIRVDEPAAELPWRSATLSQTACQRVEWLWWSPTVAEWSEWSAVVGVAGVAARGTRHVEQPVAVLEGGEGERRFPSNQRP